MTEAPPQRLRIDLAYDGTRFSGWATQPGLRTVQGELETALAKLTRSAEPVRVTVAGRTDAGVHARGQVAHLDLAPAHLDAWTGKAAASADPTERANARVRKLNGVLRKALGADDIVIWNVTEVSAAFDARFSALSRRYEYRVASGSVDPLARAFTASVPKPIDVAVLRRVSEGLTGFRDFTTFCKAREGSTAIRHLTHFDWVERPDGVFVARIQADAFCHSMVRALVGAAVAAATGRLSESEVHELANAQERTSRFAVMPAHGLSLEEITYPEESEFAARAEQTRARRSGDELEPGDGRVAE